MNKVCVGTSGWAYASWKPEFYPAKTPASKFLSYYATQLNCVEVNHTFRVRPSAKALQNWSEATPADFSFATKAHQRITHLKRLKDVTADVEGFFDSLQPLAGKLGPVLFQLPPNLKEHIDRLQALLECIPPGRRVAIEFRNDGWFSDRVFDLMREHDAALCIAESDDLQVPEVRTASFSYYRFRKSDYSETDLREVADRLARAAKGGDVYAFLKHEETPAGALNARRLLQTFSLPVRGEAA